MKNELLSYVSRHLDKEILLEDLAKVFGYSPYHLHRKISEELQEPLGQFIKRQRIETAAYLIALTQLPLSEIKYLVGYENDSAFSKAFRSVMGVAPRLYREQNLFKQQLEQLPQQYLSLNVQAVRLAPQEALMFDTMGNYFHHSTYLVWEEVRAYMEKHHLNLDNFSYYTVLYACQNVSGTDQNRMAAAVVPKGLFSWEGHRRLQGTLPAGRFASYKICCSPKEFQQVAFHVGKHLIEETKFEHAQGLSFFHYPQFPDYKHSENILFDWLMPIM